MLELTTNNAIYLDGQPTGLWLAQRPEGTVVYVAGRAGREYAMPHRRYSAAADAPLSGVPGRAQLEADVRALLVRLEQN